MPGRHITDHQMELYMTHRRKDRPAVAAAKVGFNTATAQRIPVDLAQAAIGPGMAVYTRYEAFFIVPIWVPPLTAPTPYHNNDPVRSNVSAT